MTTILVTSNLDSGPNTLRDAINTANSNSGDYVINIDSSITLISLTSNTLNITKNNGNLSIISLSGTKTTITRSGSSMTYYRIFTLDYSSNSGFKIYFENLRITGGRHSKGCGIYARNCNLEINDCVISGNIADIIYDTKALLEICAGAGAFISECEITISKSIFRNNICTLSPSLVVSLTVSDMLVGGGLYVVKSVVNINTSNFEINRILPGTDILSILILSVSNLLEGGGIYAKNNKAFNIKDSVITDNLIQSINIIGVGSLVQNALVGGVFLFTSRKKVMVLILLIHYLRIIVLYWIISFLYHHTIQYYQAVVFTVYQKLKKLQLL